MAQVITAHFNGIYKCRKKHTSKPKMIKMMIMILEVRNLCDEYLDLVYVLDM